MRNRQHPFVPEYSTHIKEIIKKTLRRRIGPSRSQLNFYCWLRRVDSVTVPP